MGYKVLYDNQLLFDPYTDDRITDTKLSSKLNAASYFDFTIAPTHSLYSKLAERAGEVRIYFNNLILFKGEITKIDEDFEGNYSVSCTGVLDYLTATRVRPYSTVEGEQPLKAPSSYDGYFQWLIDQHNSNCLDSRKHLSVGVNQGNMLDKNNYIYRSSEQRPTTASEIEDKILNSAGGYLFVRYQDDLNILDLYADVHDVNTQIIDYGVNMLDFTKTTTTESQYTAVVATGYTPDPPKDQPNAKMKPITLEGCTDGGTPYSSTIVKMGDRVYDVEAVKRYGYHEYYVSNTDITTYDGLLYYACKTLNTLLSPAQTISVKAVELALIMGDKYKHLQLGQAVRIRSKPRKVDEYLMVNSIDLDLMNPENTTFDLGASYDTLTGQQSAYLKSLNASINASLDTMDALGDNVKNSAKLAQEAKEKAETAADAAEDAAAKADKVTDTANSAVAKADTAISTSNDTKAKVTLVEKQATEAKNAADTAKKAADDATTAANSAQSSATKANEAASSANTAASKAQSTADSALSSAAQANKDVGSVKTQITEINKEMTSVKQDAATLRDDLSGQITTVKETMEADYAKKSELSTTETNLKTEISKSAAGVRTEVSQTYSTKKELETTTKAAQTAQSTADAAKKAAESNASDLANAVSKFDGDISDLKDQIDGAIQTWFYDGIPNALNEPEVNWTTEKDRQTHLGDLYYDNKTGFCYRYMNQNGVYSWARIQDTDVTKALSDAAKAQGTANAKKRIFVATPTPPYEVGDLWVQGSTGDILRCQTPKLDGQAYAEADWVKASKYTDDTAVKNLSNTVEKTYATKSTVSQLSDKIEQTVSSVEEVRTDASAAKTTADNAKKAADDAAAAANTAHETATAAQTAATTAKEHATAASTAASTAKANADAAQAAANKANAALADAQKNLTDLQNRADVTDEELTAAKKAVASAQTAADSANSAASKAKELASTAQSTADTAKANAATAQSKANAAASAASTAQSTADTAKANAKKAQDDVDALKNRVTQAETKITQNSEAIALRATKTEVTSAVDNIRVGGRNLYTGTSDFSNVPGGNTWKNLDDWVLSNTSIGYSGIKKDARRYDLWCGLYQQIYLPIGTYTLSAYLSKSGVAQDFSVRMYVSDANSVPNKAEVTNNGILVTDSLTNQYVRYAKTFTVTKAGTVAARFEKAGGSNTDKNELFWVTALKLEAGNKATDWSPAPEDLQADAATKANTALSESKKYTDAQLKITSDSITSTVSQVSSVANAAKSTADTVKNDLVNLSVGGRNLARGTNMLYGLDGIGWSNNGNNDPTLVHIDGSWAIKVTRGVNSDKYLPTTVLNNWVLLEWGNTYKYSAEIMSPKDFNTGGGNTPLHYWLDSSSTPDIIKPNRSNTTAGISVSGFRQVYMLGGKWYRFEYTVTTADTKPAEAYEYPMIRCFLYGSNNGSIGNYTEAYIRNLKIEKGNKATDWSPAPEDYSTTTEMNSSINQTAESIKSTVAATYVNNQTLSSYATKSQLEQTSTSLTSRIQTTETTVSGMSTTVKNVNDYMTFARENNQPTLTIGSSSSSFRTKLTNTGEKFMQGDQTIMELDGITSTVKASRVQMGHYQWRDTGTSMQLVYIP